MTQYNGVQLEALIAAQITTNGTGAITGALLASILTDFVQSALIAEDVTISDIPGLEAALAGIPDGDIAMSDVTGLVDALAGKSATGHTHVMANITDLAAALATMNSSIAANTSAITALQNADAALDARLDIVEASGGGDEVSELSISSNVRAEATLLGFKPYLPIYADNAAARAAGLTDDMLYRTAAGAVYAVIPTSVSGGIDYGPPPAGAELISTADVTDPHYEGAADYYWLWGRQWAHDAAYEAWQLSSADDNHVVFEIRAGDYMGAPHPFPDSPGTERNRLVMRNADWLSPTDDILATGYVMIEGPVITSNFFQVAEVHTYGGSTSQAAKKFEMVISNERWQITANGNGAYDIPYTSSVPIVRGQWYKVLYYIKSAHSGSGRLICEIDDVRVVNKTGYTGHPTETYAALEFGIYRGTSSPETIKVHHRDWVITTGAFGTLTEPGAPPVGGGTTYGPNILVGGELPSVADGWTLLSNSAATIVTTANGDFSRLSNTTISAGAQGLSKNVTVEIGATYRVQAEAYRDAADATAVALVDAYGSGGSLGTDDTVLTTIDTIDFTTTAADATFMTMFLMAYDDTAANSYVYYRNVTVRKVL